MMRSSTPEVLVHFWILAILMRLDRAMMQTHQNALRTTLCGMFSKSIICWISHTCSEQKRQTCFDLKRTPGTTNAFKNNTMSWQTMIFLLTQRNEELPANCQQRKKRAPSRLPARKNLFRTHRTKWRKLADCQRAHWDSKKEKMSD